MMQWHWTHIILVICWGIVALAWVIGAIYNGLKAPATQKRASFLPAWIVGIVVLGLASILIPGKIWASITFNPLWLQVIGAVCLIIFTGFTLWARWVLGTMWSMTAEAKVGHQLRTTGPYRFTRHPIYTGILGMLLGSVFMDGFGRWTLYFIGSVIVFAVKIASEERLLKETFGEQYIQYQKSVPQVIPGLQLLKRH